jgi:hypothetical protein
MHSNATEARLSIRYFDVGPLSKEHLDLTHDFERNPLVSMEAAVEPLVEIVPGIQQMILKIKPLIVTPKDGLSIDESASVMLYTMELPTSKNSFYISLNEKLRSENRKELEPWFLYLRLFTETLSKFPSVIDQIVYRGVQKDISSQYRTGETCVWPSFSSCSLSVEPIKQFLRQTEPRTLFAIKSHTGKSISHHSYFPEEEEILLLAGTHFKVVANIDQGNGLHIVQLEEIQPPTPPIPSRNQPLVNQIDKCSILSEIDLRGQKLTDEDMEIIVEKAIINKKCSELYLQNNMITSHGVSIIVLGLRNNTTLQKLWLDVNRVSDIGVDSLTKILSHNNSTLKMLGLNSNGITDEGARCLAEMLKTNKILTFLRLSHNSISDRGIQLLADALTHHNNSLESIDISSNKLITDLSIDYLVQMIIRNQRLSSLSLPDCGLSENGKQRFRSMGQAKCGFKLCL